MVALLYFIIATVTLENAKGPYGDNVMTNPANIYIYIYILNIRQAPPSFLEGKKYRVFKSQITLTHETFSYKKRK